MRSYVETLMISFPYFLCTVVLGITRCKRLAVTLSEGTYTEHLPETCKHRQLCLEHSEAKVDSLAKKMVLSFRDILYYCVTTGAVWRRDVFLL